MKPVYLLDTCVISEPAKAVPNQQVLERLKEYEGRCCISSFTWNELIYGVERMSESGRKKQLFSYMMDVVSPFFPVVDYSASAAWIHGQLRSQTKAAGRALPFVDGAIAATALSNNLILVTRNLKAFSAIPHLYTENWFEDPGL